MISSKNTTKSTGSLPKTIKKEILDIIEREYIQENSFVSHVAEYTSEYRTSSLDDMRNLRNRLKEDMLKAAENLDFEKAATLRDQMNDVEKKNTDYGESKEMTLPSFVSDASIQNLVDMAIAEDLGTGDVHIHGNIHRQRHVHGSNHCKGGRGTLRLLHGRTCVWKDRQRYNH